MTRFRPSRFQPASAPSGRRSSFLHAALIGTSIAVSAIPAVSHARAGAASPSPLGAQAPAAVSPASAPSSESAESLQPLRLGRRILDYEQSNLQEWVKKDWDGIQRAYDCLMNGAVMDYQLQHKSFLFDSNGVLEASRFFLSYAKAKGYGVNGQGGAATLLAEGFDSSTFTPLLAIHLVMDFLNQLGIPPSELATYHSFQDPMQMPQGKFLRVGSHVYEFGADSAQDFGPRLVTGRGTLQKISAYDEWNAADQPQRNAHAILSTLYETYHALPDLSAPQTQARQISIILKQLLVIENHLSHANDPGVLVIKGIAYSNWGALDMERSDLTSAQEHLNRGLAALNEALALRPNLGGAYWAKAQVFASYLNDVDSAEANFRLAKQYLDSSDGGFVSAQQGLDWVQKMRQNRDSVLLLDSMPRLGEKFIRMEREVLSDLQEVDWERRSREYEDLIQGAVKYYLGQSRSHHAGEIFLDSALTSFANYLFKEREIRYLADSGAQLLSEVAERRLADCDMIVLMQIDYLVRLGFDPNALSMVVVDPTKTPALYPKSWLAPGQQGFHVLLRGGWGIVSRFYDPNAYVNYDGRRAFPNFFSSADTALVAGFPHQDFVAAGIGNYNGILERLSVMAFDYYMDFNAAPSDTSESWKKLQKICVRAMAFMGETEQHMPGMYGLDEKKGTFLYFMALDGFYRGDDESFEKFGFEAMDNLRSALNTRPESPWLNLSCGYLMGALYHRQDLAMVYLERAMQNASPGSPVSYIAETYYSRFRLADAWAKDNPYLQPKPVPDRFAPPVLGPGQ